MSTFGKKALTWWDYHNKERETIRRFVSSTHEFQLKIIEKWYPIGMIVETHSKKYKVVNYVLSNQGYLLELININDNHQKICRNPLLTNPLDSEILQLKRDINIKKLFE